MSVLYNVQGIVLVDLNIDIGKINKDSDAEIRYSYTAEIDHINNNNGATGFQCVFTAGDYRDRSDEFEASISASYAVFFDADKISDVERISIAKSITQNSVWFLFSDLFRLISGQMRRELPILPASPGEIEVSLSGTEK